MSSPGSRLLDDVFSKKSLSDDVFSKKPFLGDVFTKTPFLGDVFSRKSFFGWLLLQEAVFGWLQEVVFWMTFPSRSRVGMMSSPGSRFLDDFFSKKPFFGWCLVQEAICWWCFLQEFAFGWCLLQEVVFGWCLLQEVVFWMVSSPRSCFRKNVFRKIIFEMFGKCLEKSSNSRSKSRGQKSGGQLPAEKGLAKKPSQVLQKIDSNFKTTTQKRSGAL